MTLPFSTDRPKNPNPANAFPANDVSADARSSDPSFDAFLNQTLSSLPREQADDQFTARVMRQVEERSGFSQWRPLVAAALLVAVGYGTHFWSDWQQQMESVERLAELRAEYEVLQEELAALEKARRNQKLVYLGGENGVEYVLDVGRLASRTGSTSRADTSASSSVPVAVRP